MYMCGSMYIINSGKLFMNIVETLSSRNCFHYSHCYKRTITIKYDKISFTISWKLFPCNCRLSYRTYDDNSPSFQIEQKATTIKMMVSVDFEEEN